MPVENKLMRCNWGCRLTDKSNNVWCKILCLLNELNVVQCNILNEKWKRYEINIGNVKQVPAKLDGRPGYKCDLLGDRRAGGAPPASVLGPTWAGVLVAPRVARCVDPWRAAGRDGVTGTCAGHREKVTAAKPCWVMCVTPEAGLRGAGRGSVLWWSRGRLLSSRCSAQARPCRPSVSAHGLAWCRGAVRRRARCCLTLPRAAGHPRAAGLTQRHSEVPTSSPNVLAHKLQNSSRLSCTSLLIL